MPWTRLQSRIDNLPLILAGPILRRAEPDSVTVWLALRAPRTVTLRVYAFVPNISVQPEQVGTRATVRLGENLHVVAVTARATPQPRPLLWGNPYVYDLFFGPWTEESTVVPSSGTTLFDAEVLAPTEADARKMLLYGENPTHPLPSFALPPEDVNKLRLLHASCRKPHGEGPDAMLAIDKMIESTVANPERRPHQLFLTGDQIYADDVADVLLEMLTDAGDALLAWPAPEKLPAGTPTGQPAKSFRPGNRRPVAKIFNPKAGSEAKSHLFSFGEFCAMYLFAWSDVLWPPSLPAFADVEPEWSAILSSKETGKETPFNYAYHLSRAFAAEVKGIEAFRESLSAARRALANVPTCMIFDDHEITDDWFITLKWCKDALQRDEDGKDKLGRRVIQNGLLAYALFQAWGNTPERFQAGTTAGEPGRKLLEAVSQWDGTDTDPAYKEIATRVGIPEDFSPDGMVRSPGALDWYYTVNGARHQVLVLDTRTDRRYPGAETDPPALLLTDEAFDRQVGAAPYLGDDAVTIVVSPAPAVGVPLIEKLIQKGVGRWHGARLFVDAEAWSLQPIGFEKLLAQLFTKPPPEADNVRRSRVVVLSGDVHYGYAGRLRYSAEAPFLGPPGKTQGVLAQLTASSLKNEDWKTRMLHDSGYVVGRDLLPHGKMVGWANTSDPVPFMVGRELSTRGGRVVNTPWIVYGSPAVAWLKDDPEWLSRHELTKTPEWRYTIQFILGTDDADRGGAPERVLYPPPGNRDAALKAYLTTCGGHGGYLGKWGNGKEIVGWNNVGEISFAWTGDTRTVFQELWWWLPGRKDAFPLTKYEVDLKLEPGQA